MLRSFAYVRAQSLGDAVKRLGASGTRLHAGGTDLMGCLRDGVMQADTVVSLSGLDDLRGVAGTADGGLRIGALTTIAEVASHAGVKERYAALAQAAAVVASPQLRNQGTIGGNLCQRPRCWYFRGEYACLRKGGDQCYAMEGENRYHAIFGGNGCFFVHPSDTAPALAALDARVRLTGPRGTRTVTIDEFFVRPEKDLMRETVLEPGEIVTEIVLPPSPSESKSLYRKVRARGSWDFAMAGLALAWSMKAGRVETARLVLSGVAPVPWRRPEAERALIGQKLDAKTVAKVVEAAVLGAEPLAQNAYKVPLVRGLVEEALDTIKG